MPAFKDITGQKFGRLTVVALHARATWRTKPRHNTLWLCQCDCGKQTVADQTNLRHMQSCGCQRLERNTKHGHSGRYITGTYHSWQGMWQRCTNPKHPGYKYWGGRGIKVCERWTTFENFLADMGQAPEGWTIERMDNDGNYEPGNCKWIPKSEQNKNKRPRHAARKARPPGSPLQSRKSQGPTAG